jgi:hypothetical protein
MKKSEKKAEKRKRKKGSRRAHLDADGVDNGHPPSPSPFTATAVVIA